MLGNSVRRPVVIVGAGIVGLATAYTLLGRRPGLPLIVLEKEPLAGSHQTGHNSGVIHSGVYYRPGSLKAQLCLSGRAQLLDYLRSHNIPFRICGKLIVATKASEAAPLGELERRAKANGVPGLRLLDSQALRQIEPEVVGLSALHVPGTGIVDYTEVTRCLVSDVESMGGEVRTGQRVDRLDVLPDSVRVSTPDGTIDAGYLVNAAGLQADRVARKAGLKPPCRIVPFRGEHYTLTPHGGGLVRGLVYPVPDPDMPFLGVHLTPRIDGTVEAGPNAVLALAREGYRRSDLDLGDLASTVLYPGFAAMARRFWRTSIHESLRSLSKGMFLEDLRRMVPGLADTDLDGWGSGVRAQALGPRGELFDDFLLVESPRALHVLNAPSPAATSSFAIADHLVDRIPHNTG